MKLFSYLVLMLMISFASATPSSVTTGPYNITFDPGTSMNYTVEVMPPYENDSYTSYSASINVSNTKADIIIYDLKTPEDATISTVAATYRANVRNLNSSSVEIGKIDGKDAIITRYINPQNNKQILDGKYWVDSHKVDDSPLSEGSIEVTVYASMPQNSAEDMAIAESIINTLHIVKTQGQASQTNQPAQTAVPTIRPEPYLSVRDQNVENNGGNVIIDGAYSNGPGWVVIYNERYVPYSSAPMNNPIGYTHVDDGLSNAIKVKLNMALVTDRLYAVLFKDNGQVGAFEYPGPDYPLSLHAEKIYSFNSKTPHPMDDLRINWSEHGSSPDPYWM